MDREIVRDDTAAVKTSKHGFNYVDENEIYETQLTSYDRKVYWEYVVKRARKIPSRKKSSDTVGIDHEKAADLAHEKSDSFSPRLEICFNFVITRTWDYCYVSLFIAFLLIVSVVSDGKNIHEAINRYVSFSLLQTAILILMFISQIPPTLGIVYFMCFHNQRTHSKAETDFGKWVSVLNYLRILLYCLECSINAFY